MRKTILLAVGLAGTIGLAVPSADATVRAFWDQSQGKWVKYDMSAPTSASNPGRVVDRAYTPIRRTIVNYDGPFRPNTIVIDTSERRLYYIFEKGKAWKYGVGVGREGFQWAGADLISRKAEWPGWTPPPEMIAREKAKGRILPAYMPGGPNNPLGARALYIGGTLYRIHGSNEPWSIGRAVSSGCIRMTNDDVTDLYTKVRVGTRVVVLRGDESPATLARLANPPPPPKPEPVIVEARLKEDAVVTATVTGEMTGAVSEPAEEVEVEVNVDEDLDTIPGDLRAETAVSSDVMAPILEASAEPSPALDPIEAPVERIDPAKRRMGH